jgi:hypothetical protein
MNKIEKRFSVIKRKLIDEKSKESIPKEISLSEKDILKNWNTIKNNLMNGKFKDPKESEKILRKLLLGLETGDRMILDFMTMAYTEGMLASLEIAKNRAKEEENRELRYIG